MPPKTDKPAATPAAKPAATTAAAKPAATTATKAAPAATTKPAAAASKPAAAKTTTAAKPAAKPAAKTTATPKFTPILAASRPSVSVRAHDKDAVTGSQTLPAVFIAPIRPDIVHFVHTSMNKNARQAYCVSPDAGHQHSAESWGTGRAVARVPRVSGGGTGRAGQGAFANSCRKGRMFAPTKTWRRWHRKLNTNQKRFAVASALAASALPSLVLARGHRISNVAEIPLVANNALESISKTAQAVKSLKALGAYEDVSKAADSKKLRAGKGKMRNRRYVSRRGPLVVYRDDNGISRAFRNLPGVEVAHVDSLNLLQLAPGGHLGRFIVWTENAFTRLVQNWGTTRAASTTKLGYRLPRPQMSNSDLARIINSDEIQSKLRPSIPSTRTYHRHKNPLTNLGAEVKLNPYALALRRSELLSQESRKKAREALLEAKRKGTAPKAPKSKHTKQSANYSNLVDDSKFALSSANAARTGGFNVSDPKAKAAEKSEE